MSYGFGIDIGGTKTSMVLGTDKGKILGLRIIPTLKNRQVPACVKDMIANLEVLAKEQHVPISKIKGIGIALPGAVNPASGLVPRSPNLQGWAGFPLRKKLQNYFKLPVHMMNDANASVMGEKLFGCAKNKHNILYVTISTGIGGGIIANNNLIQGANFVAGEIGHVNIVPDGNLCNCGRRGCLEAYASGTAIAKIVKKQIKANASADAKKLRALGERLSAKDIGDAAREGNKIALNIYRNAGQHVGIGIGSLLNVLNPEIVILGGGVLKSAPKIFWSTIIKSAKKYAWQEAIASTKIVKASLGDKVGNFGALALAFV